MARYWPFAGKGAALVTAVALVTGGISAVGILPGLSASAAAAEVTLVSSDFESPYAPWVARGPVTMSVTSTDAHSGSSSLLVTGRTGSWNGPSITDQILAPGSAYTMSAWVKLAPDATGSSGMKFTVQYVDSSGNTQYGQVNTPVTVTNSAWAQISGDWTLPSGATNTVIYIEAADIGAVQPSFLVDDASIVGPTGQALVSSDFESPYEPWVARGPVTMSLTSTDAHSGSSSLLVTGRTGNWNGPSITQPILTPGAAATFSAWVKLAPDATGSSGMKFTVQYDDASGTTHYDQVGSLVTVTNTDWSQIGGTYTLPLGAVNVVVYIEAADIGADHPSFLVDDATITGQASAPAVPDLTIPPIKDAKPASAAKPLFNVGVALGTNELSGGLGDLASYHFDQITPANAMKPESWYNADHSFKLDAASGGVNTDAQETIAYALANNMPVYGHNLVWDQQTPAWFFQDANGNPLDPTNPADVAIVKQELIDHIDNVAKALYEMAGPFGSATNPIMAFDVVNEPTDTSTSDHLLHDQWYQFLGPDYVNLAFQTAEKAFNQTYAASGSNRPVKLFVNDFDTENSTTKAQDLHDLIQGWLAQGVPIDGVGHQFHVAPDFATPTANLLTALNTFKDLPIVEAVTEMDVPISIPSGSTAVSPTDPRVVTQGYYYEQAFAEFTQFAQANPGKLFSVTLWGPADDQDLGGWRQGQAPLAFDANLQAKPAYCGIMLGMTGDPSICTLPPQTLTANVFSADVPATAAGVTSAEWAKVPLNPVGDGSVVDWQARWQPDYLAAYVTVADTSASASDAVTFDYAGATCTVHRTPVAGDCPDAAVVATATGYDVVAHLPLDNAKQGDQVAFNVSVAGAGSDPNQTVWNQGGDGLLTLIEPMSFVQIPQTATAPTLDGTGSDPAWANAPTVTTTKVTDPDGATAPDGLTPATAAVKLLWGVGSNGDGMLYVLANVTDSSVETPAANPAYQQDSVELYTDRSNLKTGPYSTDATTATTQMRVGADNAQSFGRGIDVATQQSWITSATSTTSTGYIVEAAVDLGPLATAGSYQGMDFQVNDVTNGTRYFTVNWADGTDNGYQSDAHWGVGQLMPLAQPSPSPSPSPSASAKPHPSPSAPPTPPAHGGLVGTGGTLAGGSAGLPFALLGLGCVLGAGALLRKARQSR